MEGNTRSFPVVLFIILYNAILTFESVDKISKCNHSNESSRVPLSFSTLCFSIF